MIKDLLDADPFVAGTAILTEMKLRAELMINLGTAWSNSLSESLIKEHDLNVQIKQALNKISTPQIDQTYHTIKGTGIIEGPMTNDGLISAENGTLYLRGEIYNNATLQSSGPGSILSLSDVDVSGSIYGGLIKTDNGGKVYLNGDAMMQNTTMEAGSYCVVRGNNYLNDGNILKENANIVIQNGATLQVRGITNKLHQNSGISIKEGGVLAFKKDGDNDPILLNYGMISLDSEDPGKPALLQADGAEAVLSGKGRVVLGGSKQNYLQSINGGRLINSTEHNILGAGNIIGPFDNYGVIRAEGGSLSLSGEFLNSGTIEGEGLDTSLDFRNASVRWGWLKPQDGTVNLNGNVILKDIFLAPGSYKSFNTNTFSGKVVLDSGSGFVIHNRSTLYLQKNGDFNPILTNHGTISINSGSQLDWRGDWDFAHLIADGCTATLEGSGSVVLGGGYNSRLSSGYGGSWVNAADHKLRGNGYIDGPLTNYGEIIGDAGGLTLQGTFENYGTIKTSGGEASLTLKYASITGGQIIPGSGAINLSGYTTVKDATFGTGTTNVAYGTDHNILLGNINLTSDAEMFVAYRARLDLGRDSDRNPILTNNGTIKLNSGSQQDWLGYWDYAHLVANGCIATLEGHGSVVLGGGHDSRIYSSNGGSWVNAAGHTIRGSGYIDGPLTNEGLIIADNGTLTLSGTIQNHNVMRASGAGNVLALNYGTFSGGNIDPQDGGVDLKGETTLQNTTFKAGNYSVYNSNNLLADGNTLAAVAHVSVQYGGSLGMSRTNNILQSGSSVDVNDRASLVFQKDGDLNPVLTNHGTIKLNSGSQQDWLGYWDYAHLIADGCTATLAGNGSVVLGGGHDSSLTATNGGSFTNTGDHTIRGAGYINAPLINYGKLIADNGTLALNQPVVNLGRLMVEGGTLQANQTVTGNGGVFANSGQINIYAGFLTNHMFLGKEAGIFVAANQTVEIMGSLGIAMTNEQNWVWQDGSTLLMSGGTLEVAGHTGDGLFGNHGNFSIPHLIISGNVSLVDWLDNENHSSPEALYVGALDILAGSILNLNDQLLFLQISPDVFHQIVADDPMFANVHIINQPLSSPVPLPSAVLLMGVGLLRLANMKRRLRKKLF